MASAPPGPKPSPRMSPSQAAAKPAPAAAKPAPVAAKPAPAAAKPAPVAAEPAPTAAEPAPTAGAKDEPRHGVRMLRVRGKLADGREFVSSPTFLVPVDPAAQGSKS